MTEHPGPPLEAGAVRAHSPGRVNLIGDHTDYNDGVALPMAIDLGTTVGFTPDASRRVVLHSEHASDPAAVDLDVALDPAALQALEPPWARFVAGAVAIVRPGRGGTGSVTTTLPVGAGLSSSTALVVACALAFGLESDALSMARTCQRAEEAASGVPGGLMDQIVEIAGSRDCALLIDFAALTYEPVGIPGGLEVFVVHSGETRSLGHSPYATRRAECDAAAAGLGPLGLLDAPSAGAIPDAVLRRRVRHVVSECARVRAVVEAFGAGDVVAAGRLMTESHRSLASDFEVSTPALDELVAMLVGRPGVLGARLTGAGFGGCVVALAEAGALEVGGLPAPAWRVRASEGAALLPG